MKKRVTVLWIRVIVSTGADGARYVEEFQIEAASFRQTSI